MSDIIPCPHGCGANFTDLWDYSWETNEVITECDECGGAVDIIRERSVSYEVYKGTDEDGVEIVTDRQRERAKGKIHMSYIQLTRGNDWGYVYFSRPGQALSPQGTCDAKKYGLTFLDGAEIRVQWPDGTETTERVSHQLQHNDVFDHGHTSRVEFQLAGITKTVHGIACWFPLDACKIHDGDIPNP